MENHEQLEQMEQKGILNMSKVEIKWNTKKCLIDWKENRKEKKKKKKEITYKTNSKMADVNSSILIITLNVNSLTNQLKARDY